MSGWELIQSGIETEVQGRSLDCDPPTLQPRASVPVAFIQSETWTLACLRKLYTCLAFAFVLYPFVCESLCGGGWGSVCSTKRRASLGTGGGAGRARSIRNDTPHCHCHPACHLLQITHLPPTCQNLTTRKYVYQSGSRWHEVRSTHTVSVHRVYCSGSSALTRDRQAH